MRLVSAKEAKEYFHITGATLYQWKAKGKINAKQLSTKKILYDIDSFEEFQPKRKQNVIYARVSNTKQADDLSRQIEIVKSYAISNGVKIDRVYKEIASGMNDNRTILNKILKSSDWDILLVENKDRLTRFGFNYIQTLLETNGKKIIVVNNADDSKEDLMKDLISVIYSFSARMYGLRRKKSKQEIIDFIEH